MSAVSDENFCVVNGHDWMYGKRDIIVGLKEDESVTGFLIRKCCICGKEEPWEKENESR